MDGWTTDDRGTVLLLHLPPPEEGLGILLFSPTKFLHCSSCASSRRRGEGNFGFPTIQSWIDASHRASSLELCTHRAGFQPRSVLFIPSSLPSFLSSPPSSLPSIHPSLFFSFFFFLTHPFSSTHPSTDPSSSIRGPLREPASSDPSRG